MRFLIAWHKKNAPAKDFAGASNNGGGKIAYSNTTVPGKVYPLPNSLVMNSRPIQAF